MGARWTFNPPVELREMIREWTERSADWSPVMQRIAGDMEQFVEVVVVPTAGEGKWKPMSPSTIERHRAHPLLRLSGGLLQATGRDWSKTNAAVINVSDHAHLMEGGVQRRTTALYQERGKRKSRASVRDRLARGEKGAMHSPPREFVYVSETRADELYGPWILDYFFGELE